MNQSYNTGVFFNRQMDYVNRVFFLSRFAKDFRLTNVSKLLYDKFQESKKNLHEIYEKYGRRELAVYMISTFFAEAGGGVRCDLLFGLYGAGGGQIYVRIVFGALERLVSSKGENFTDPRGSQ